MMKSLSYKASLVALLLAFTLAGCESSGFPKLKTASAKDSTKTSSKAAEAVAAAAREAAGSGMTHESLMFQEKLYQSDPRNPDYILNYARALRYADKIDEALLVIRTPAKSTRASEPLMTECAMILISAANYDEALTFAQKAVEKDDDSPNAHHALALALSGLGNHADAQLQFEEALKIWPETRDKTPIINNLAMSLAAQGKISEAQKVMTLATGEALRSETYQNNRALLGTLKDKNVSQEKLDPTMVRPVDPSRMQPIVD